MATINSSDTANSYPFVLAITGASGAPYATRLLQAMLVQDVDVHVTISPSGAAVINQELGIAVDLRRVDFSHLLTSPMPWGQTDAATQLAAGAAERLDRLTYHHYQDYMTPIASGSFRTSAMVICPCSGSTLSGVARAAASNLIQRAAEVHLKEHRKLILVPRETPMSTLQLENLHRLAAAGAVLLPAMPGWYHGVTHLDDLINFVVGRILDQLDLDNAMIKRWKDE